MIKGTYTFMANPQKPSMPDGKPRKMEYATLQVADDHIMIINRSGEQIRLDKDAAQALALVLPGVVL